MTFTEGRAISLHAAYYLAQMYFDDWFQWQWRKRKAPLTDEQLREEQIRHRRIKRQALNGEF
jgi:hypothetical protein